MTTKTLNWLWASMVTGGPPLASIEMEQFEQSSVGRGPCMRKMVPPVACEANVMEVEAAELASAVWMACRRVTLELDASEVELTTTIWFVEADPYEEQ